MKTLKLFFPALFIVVVLGSACGHVSMSGEMGDKFYSYLQQKNYEAIVQMLDNEALQKYSKKEWINMLASRNEYLGKPKSYKTVGFHTETLPDKKIIKLDYKVDNPNGEVFEEIKLVVKKDCLKLLSYSFVTDVAMAEK